MIPCTDITPMAYRAAETFSVHHYSRAFDNRQWSNRSLDWNGRRSKDFSRCGVSPVRWRDDLLLNFLMGRSHDYSRVAFRDRLCI